MNVLLIGDENRVEEIRRKFAENNSIHFERGIASEDEDYADYDMIFDLNFDDDPENIQYYANLKGKPVFVSAVKTAMAEAAYFIDQPVKCLLIGMNALPTFIEREKWELSLLHSPQKDDATKWLEKLEVEGQFVQDRVGLVTPRILFMIMNEACYTVQEGTATMDDIDQAMKLGTNYPMGPFEWADKIGVADVFETLAAIYEDTKDERYKICPLLKTKYLKNQSFRKKSAAVTA